MRNNDMQDNNMKNDFAFPRDWEMYVSPPVAPELQSVSTIPDSLRIAGAQRPGCPVRLYDGVLDLSTIGGGAGMGKTAFLIAELIADKPGSVTLGLGGDCRWISCWVNGELVCDTLAKGHAFNPPEPHEHCFSAALHAGRNVMAVRIISDRTGFSLQVAGPSQLRSCPSLRGNVQGDCALPEEWMFYGPLDAPAADLDVLLEDRGRGRALAAALGIKPQTISFSPGTHVDIESLRHDKTTDTGFLTAWLSTEVTVERDLEVPFGLGGMISEFRVNGRAVFTNSEAYADKAVLADITHNRVAAKLQAGTNHLALKLMKKPSEEPRASLRFAIGGPDELRAAYAERRAWQQRMTAMTEKHDVVPKGPITYVNPAAEVIDCPTLSGSRYRDRVPATYDVAERSALCINALTGATNPLADHELYFHVEFFHNPVTMAHEVSDCCQIKFMEALPLLRMASGSQIRLEVDEAWQRVLCRSLGPDGLYYYPTDWMGGRSWGCFGVHVMRADGSRTNADDASVTHLAFAPLVSRAMNVMQINYLRDRNPFWLTAMQSMTDRLNALSVHKDGTAFMHPGYLFEPNARYTPVWPETIAAKKMTVIEKDCARQIEGLARFYRLTGYEPARELGEKISRFIRQSGCHFGADGDFLEPQHFHVHTVTLLNMLELASTIGDQETIAFVRRSYEWAKTPAAGSADSIGFFPEYARPGFYTCEGCEVAEMVALALKLSKIGAGDYYNDAERWTRNHFAESQLTDYQPLEHLATRQPSQPVNELDTAWRVAERNVGAFAGFSSANDYAAAQFGIMHCCTGNAARTLYWIWLEALRFQDGELRVNLLLNRASREADVYSFIPYQGKVEIKVKAPCKAIYVHAPGWIDAGSPEMTATVDGKAVKTRWEGRYLVLGPAQPGQRITVEFPIVERTVKETIGAVDYTLVIKGDTVVHIDPPGNNLPLYLRDHYRSNEPHYVEVERFLSDTVVEY